MFFAANAPAVALAGQLDRSGCADRWLPDPEALRCETDAQFRRSVLTLAGAVADDVIALLVTGLCRARTVVAAVSTRRFVYRRVLSQQEADAAAEAVLAVDEVRRAVHHGERPELGSCGAPGTT